MAHRYRFTVATYLVLGLAVLLLLAAAILILDRLSSLADTEGADATVITTSAEMAWERGRYREKTTLAQIRFTLADGRSVTTTLRPAPASKGEPTVRIRYKRHNPRQAVTEEPNPWFYGFAIGLFSSGVLCLVLAHFVALRDGPVQRVRHASPMPKSERPSKQ